MDINIIAKHKRSSFLLAAASIIFFGIAHVLNLKEKVPVIEIKKQDTALNVKPLFLTAFSFGNKRLISDIIWIQTLIESDLDHYKKQDLNNWLFLRFNTITYLDPLFYENYLYGGQYLSIIKDDVIGAAVIFEKGLKHFPDDYALNYNAGMNYYNEGNEYQKGLERLLKIKDHPKAPKFLSSIINKLRLQIGFDYNSALLFLNETIRTTLDPVVRNRILKDIYALKAERDLKCLNENKSDCERADSEGRPYIYRDGKFQTEKPFELYRLKRKRDQ